MKMNNPPSPPFSKGGMGGFGSYFQSTFPKKIAIPKEII
jgi:hypothetical protein